MEYSIQKEQGSVREIAHFLNTCWKSAYAGILAEEYLSSQSDDSRASGLQKWQDDGLIEFLSLREGDVLVGVCGYGKSIIDEYPDDGEIHSIYLLPQYIGKGYGHTLFIEAERLLVDDGYKNLVLDVFSANVRALAFYARHGCTVVNESTINFGGVDYPYKILRKHGKSEVAVGGKRNEHD
jgi:ribosomal protein S18 acetylase RimI-like enzyme